MTASPPTHGDHLTVICSPYTGLLYESASWWNDAHYAFMNETIPNANWTPISAERKADIVQEHGADWLPTSPGEYTDNMPF